jgi:N-acetylglutamate synthase-like GNAT family acetyltransferase
MASRPAHEGIDVRPARPAERGGVEALLRASDLPVDGVADHWHAFHVAIAGAQIVGAAGLERYGDAALVRSVVVRAPWRGLGIAGALCDVLEGGARRGGVRNLYLLTETAESYFSRRGFEVVPRKTVPDAVRASAEFRGACPSTAVCMMKFLGRLSRA